ncbi:hypothetical protein AB0I81_59145 [Nonomuraea sp. NPDC050404]|uniref:hypothetical protein n=1 Tax=Nonomuraea sp. NPDC050404 TaxID=3155783 RepID=UPI0033D6C577
MKSLLNIAGVIAFTQGLIAFVGLQWFDGQWGLLPRLVDLSVPVCLGTAAIGGLLLLAATAVKTNRD